MSRDVKYEDLVKARIPCEHCTHMLSTRDVVQVFRTATFTDPKGKHRVLRCGNCGGENQLTSEE